MQEFFNVMIASPRDVTSERSIVKEVIYEWNAVHSERENIVLLPVESESHSSPDMGRPQEVLNRQTVDKCDLLVGIFGTRIGTNTGEYDSGTIEEIERHGALGKPVMIYYSKELGDPDTFDSDQYTKLKEWKKKNESRWLYDTYNDAAEFKDKFYRQLEIKVNQHKIFQFRAEGINSDFEKVESENNIPQLSDIAKMLLKEAASQDDQGHILYYYDGIGPIIQIGGSTSDHENIIPDRSSRTVAQWRAALKELTDAELLEDEGDYGEMFRVTPGGYDVANMTEATT